MNSTLVLSLITFRGNWMPTFHYCNINSRSHKLHKLLLLKFLILSTCSHFHIVFSVMNLCAAYNSVSHVYKGFSFVVESLYSAVLHNTDCLFHVIHLIVLGYPVMGYIMKLIIAHTITYTFFASSLSQHSWSKKNLEFFKNLFKIRSVIS